MADAQLHITAGTIIGIGIAIFLSFLSVNPSILFLGMIICIIASEFPDIDHNYSIPRKIMRGIITGIVGVLCLYLFFSWRFWKSSIFDILIFAAIPTTFLFTYEYFIPRHRGAIHKIPGFLIFLGAIFIAAYFMHINIIDLLVLLLFGAVGFTSHIILDQLFH